jgi:hypothetical protein
MQADGLQLLAIPVGAAAAIIRLVQCPDMRKYISILEQAAAVPSVQCSGNASGGNRSTNFLTA